MKIQINKLKLNEGQVKDVPKNPRFIKDDKYEKLKKSLTEDPEFMDYNPVLIYDNNGELIVMGGNMRVRAAKELGWKEINGEVMPYETPPQTIRARIIKHNSGYGADDWDLLANEWSDDPLPDWGLDVPNDWNQSEIVEDEAPPVADVAISKLGEIYQLGRHRLMCGDSTNKDNLDKLMDGVKADMVFTDPPYGMDLDTDFTDMKGISGGNKYRKVEGDDKDYDPAHIFNTFGYCKEIFLWGADYYAERVPDRLKGSWIVWDKTDSGVRTNTAYDKMFGSNFELCWSRVKHKRAIVGALWKGIFGLSSEDTRSRQHPTQKPVKLCTWFIRRFSKQNIVDLFGGSGSTLIACEQLDRTCYVMELDPKYCDVIRKRYWKFVNENNEEGWEDGTPAIA